MTNDWIYPDWPAPKNVRAVVTTRGAPPINTINESAFNHFNFALHVGDNEESVLKHRAVLAKKIGLAAENLYWLNQVHGQIIVTLPDISSGTHTADGSETMEHDLACIVMTADCLPVLLCSHDGAQVAAIHAGWKGLSEGILLKAIEGFQQPEKVIVWLGPAISQKHFEVGEEVRQAFISSHSDAKNAFIPSQQTKKWMADLYALARIQLNSIGVNNIYGGNFCTYSEEDKFYSYRRDGISSGRMASLIYISSN